MSFYVDRTTFSDEDMVEVNFKVNSFDELENVDTRGLEALMSKLEKGGETRRKRRPWRIRIIIIIERD
jgi:phenylalanine-4-hydroxylase